MIDIRNERVVSLTEASKDERLPRRRKGKSPHVATLYRWAQSGLGGVQLETLRVGGTLCTSIKALQRFFDRLSSHGTVGIQTSSVTRRQREHAERELNEAGF